MKVFRAGVLMALVTLLLADMGLALAGAALLLIKRP
jgi:hypothetical protein